MTEIWKDVDGFVGSYQVSNFGRVRSIDRYVSCGHSKVRFQKGTILKQSLNHKGYLRIRISRSRKEKYSLLVHRLVALAFIPNPNNYPQINHIDGCKTNNHYKNLEWCDNSYNQIHANLLKLNDHSKYKSGKPERPTAKLDIATRKVIALYNSLSEAGSKNNIDSHLIGAVCRKARKSTGGFAWAYATPNMKVGDIID